MNGKLKLRAYHKIRKCYVKVLALEFNDDGPSLLKFELNGNIYMEVATNFVLEQYTGLKDKNSKEIYEGDIVREHNETARVEFEYGGFSPFCSDRFPLDACLCEIIGNIHDNPELEGKI